MLNPRIIYEDEAILAIDKPAGITVNRAESVKNQTTIQDWASVRLAYEIEKENGTDFSHRAGLVHRLDKETSGILLLAKSQDSFIKLQSQFKMRHIKKKYQVLVHGIVKPNLGTITAPVGRLPWNRERFGVIPDGREAITDYKVITTYKNNNVSYSFLETTPHTGRTHQIRVHLKYIGHSVVGDAFYAGRKRGREDRKFCPRQFLHAASLELCHPKTQEKLIFNSPLPADLKQVLKFLTKTS